MSCYRKIFVVADERHPVSAAVRRGAQLARLCDAELTLALFVHDIAVDRAAARGSGPREAFVVQRRERLEAEVRPFIDPAVQLRFEAAWAPRRRDSMLAAVLDGKPDLVIKDITHVSALRRLVAAPLDWQLLRTMPAPLMLVQPATTQLPRRVLAAVDAAVGEGAEGLNDRVLAAARLIAACNEARVDVAHAYPHDPVREGVLEGLYAELAAENREAFAQFASAHAVALERRHWVTGEAGPAIHRLAGLLHTDLIVLGSVYRSTLERFALGTTAESLIHHSAHDLLLVKPEGFVEELARHLDLDGLRRQYLAAA